MITLYSAKWCRSCIGIKRFLDERGVQYSIIDVDQVSPPEFVQSLPTLVIGKTILRGADCNPKKIRDVLEHARNHK